MKTPTYNWFEDPKGYKTITERIPKDRCFHCGSKFVNAQYAAFCNICDNEMTPDAEDSTIFVVTDKANKQGYLISRREYVANRIRIPDDIKTEEEYKKKLQAMEEPEQPMKATFTRADDLLDMD